CNLDIYFLPETVDLLNHWIAGNSPASLQLLVPQPSPACLLFYTSHTSKPGCDLSTGGLWKPLGVARKPLKEVQPRRLRIRQRLGLQCQHISSAA
ncbi:hypothetical protein ATANTOWER_002304, partial [Ataeniobius toweri]|nr:hypothetical protein [Ataeniobius toweri]